MHLEYKQNSDIITPLSGPKQWAYSRVSLYIVDKLTLVFKTMVFKDVSCKHLKEKKAQAYVKFVLFFLTIVKYLTDGSEIP